MQLEAHLRLCQNCLCYYRSAQRLLSLSVVHRASANYYDLLGVKPDATLEQIKNAFFNKSRKLHPDSDPSNPGLHSQFVALNEAYRVLSREGSRKEYDIRIRQPYRGSQAFGQTSSYTYSEDAAESRRYWEQFRHGSRGEMSAEQWEENKKRNARLVGYCVLAIVASLGTHYFGFRKLEEFHNNFMDEKDQTITAIYNESKERARVNGFKKQTEILRQKHAEFLEKYKLRTGGEDK